METYAYWNQEGILPGPGETESEYRERADYCLTLRSTFQEQVDKEFQGHVLVPVAQQGLERIEKLYGIRPTWIPFFYSNYRLPFWQGGCAWIFQQSESSPTSAFFQLRKIFSSQETYLKIYSRQEIVAHELAHVGRMKYEEPRYEELLAYRTSYSPFRRYWGPLFTTPAQSGIFALLLLLILMADLITLIYQPELYAAIQWISMLPLIWLVWLVYDLVERQRRFDKVLRYFPEKAAYRLTDREIDQFAGMDEPEIQAYMARQTCLRWQCIHQLMAGGKNSDTKVS